MHHVKPLHLKTYLLMHPVKPLQLLTVPSMNQRIFLYSDFMLLLLFLANTATGSLVSLNQKKLYCRIFQFVFNMTNITTKIGL